MWANAGGQNADTCAASRGRPSQDWYLHRQQEEEEPEGVGCGGQTPPGADQVAKSSKESDAHSKAQTGQGPCTEGQIPATSGGQQRRRPPGADSELLSSYPSWPSRTCPRTPAPGRRRPHRCLHSSGPPAGGRQQTPRSWAPRRSGNQRPPPGTGLQERDAASPHQQSGSSHLS